MNKLSNNGLRGYTSSQTKRRLGYIYFIAAAVFLFNPCINIVDVLPDFFGYSFLLAGLRKWADLCPNTADAYAGLNRLRWFMLLKFIAIALLPVVQDPKEHNNFVLLLTFAFLVIELMYALPALNRIFDGLEYFATRFGGNAIIKGAANVRTLTKLFLFVKSFFVLIPELCSLSDFEYSGYVYSGVQIDIARYRIPLAGINLFVGTVIGICWLVGILVYIGRVFGDAGFIERVHREYDAEIGTNVSLHRTRSLRTFTTFIIAGIAFFPNFWIDGINVVPTFIGAALICAGMLKLKKSIPVCRMSVIVPALFTVLSAVSFGVSFWFAANYGINDIWRSWEAYDFYNYTLIFSLLEYAAMTAAVVCIFKEMNSIVTTYLGADPGNSDKMLSAIYTSQMKEVKRQLLIGFVGFIIALVAGAAYTLLRVDAEMLYLIPFIVTGIWCVYMAAVLNRIYDYIEYKFM